MCTQKKWCGLMFRSILWLSQTRFEYETFRPHLLCFRYKGTAMGRMTPRKNRSFTRKIVSSKHFFQQKKDLFIYSYSVAGNDGSGCVGYASGRAGTYHLLESFTAQVR